ncbi:MAG TPA: hypothetical protein VEU09_02785 [Candidatus Binatia bacterium]|nr:hypothetical protein [Candidatus Binatia bacterium]
MRSLLLRGATVCALALAALSCASSSVFQLSVEEQAGLRLAMDTPLTFLVPRDHSLKTWDRAQEFIDRYSTMKLRSVQDSVLVSYETPTYQNDPSPVALGSGIRYGYSVSRHSDPDGIQIAVKCTPSSSLGEKDADQNAHIAAYFIKLGYIACDRCIVR